MDEKEIKKFLEYLKESGYAIIDNKNIVDSMDANKRLMKDCIDIIEDVKDSIQVTNPIKIKFINKQLDDLVAKIANELIEYSIASDKWKEKYG